MQTNQVPIVFNTKVLVPNWHVVDAPVRISGHWHPHVRSGNPMTDVQHGVEIPAGFYVYVHRGRHDKMAFYVGKGCHGRAWSFQGRSKSWQVCVMQQGLQVDLWYYGLAEDEAFDWEKSLIEFYLGTDRQLVNVQHGTDLIKTT